MTICAKHFAVLPPRIFKLPAIAVLLLIQIALQSCSNSDAPGDARSEDKTQPVIVETVQWRQRTTDIEAVGTSRARQSVTVYPQASGEVTAVNFRAGDRVNEGHTLVQLDDRDERLAVELAQVQLADAERLYQRYQRSQGAGAVTESTLDEAKSALDQARIQLQRVHVALDYHSVEAPFTGIVGLSDIDPGAQITPDTAVATIDDRSLLLVTFEVPEVFYGQLQEGQIVTLTTWSANGPEYQGRIHAVDSRIDAQTRTFAVRAALDNQDDQLRPGMSFKVRLSLTDGRYPAIPEIALQWGGDGAYVWKVVNGETTRVAATIVQRLQGKILIDAELEDGAQVVTEGLHRVREGHPVQVEEIAQ